MVPGCAGIGYEQLMCCCIVLQGSHVAPGQLLLLNTPEAFKRLDKKAALNQVSNTALQRMPRDAVLVVLQYLVPVASHTHQQLGLQGD